MREEEEFNMKVMIEFFRKANCPSSVEWLEKCVREIQSETCDVCVQGEDQGCFSYDKEDIFHEKRIPCKIGQFLGETPY